MKIYHYENKNTIQSEKIEKSQFYCFHPGLGTPSVGAKSCLPGLVLKLGVGKYHAMTLEAN